MGMGASKAASWEARRGGPASRARPEASKLTVEVVRRAGGLGEPAARAMTGWMRLAGLLGRREPRSVAPGRACGKMAIATQSEALNRHSRPIAGF